MDSNHETMQSFVRAWKEIEKAGKIEDEIIKNYRKLFSITPEDERALRVCFRPLTVPARLLEEQVLECVQIYHYMCMDDEQIEELTIDKQPLIVLADDIRAYGNVTGYKYFVQCLQELFDAKVRVKDDVRKYESSAQLIDNLLLDEQNKFFQKMKADLKNWL